jgi:predicted acetylornithine/succinylornithine family transaminase
MVFERGEGPWLFDTTGRRYLDFISGVGVCSLGHAHPALVSALSHQVAVLAHTSNLFNHPWQAPVADRLAALSGLDAVFLCNSGTEAVEACLKFARKYWHARGTPRRHFVALEHSFHGRTVGALSVTWDPHYRDPFAPLMPDVTFVSAADPAALADALSENTAAIIVEPIQGEGGVRPLSREFAAAVTDACSRTGALLIADEVQCGLGRTGVPFYSNALGLRPDLMAVGKALGAGMPVAAALFSSRVADAAAPGDHGTTYGGNLLSCRAALAFLEELMDRGLLDHVRKIGALLEDGLHGLASAHPSVKALRGAGLMWGLEIDRDPVTIVDAARNAGLLINRTGGNVIRLLPPFVIDEQHVTHALARLGDAIDTTGGPA